MRGRVFRRLVLEAYDRSCAITGLKFINGGGRAEVEAAHIKPVEANGPDDTATAVAFMELPEIRGRNHIVFTLFWV